ncbi:MAG TPA: hypothetical protein DCX07_02315 [Phycisphaerales bacterium]|nr:hypothetical protein [Phycisphaerales bacterium]
MSNTTGVTTGRSTKRVVEVLLVIVLLVGILSVLMPSLRRSKEVARLARMRDGAQLEVYPTGAVNTGLPHQPSPAVLAQVQSFVAEIDLTSRISIGTAQPESIYQAKFHAKVEARNPAAAQSECELRLPLPPQLISLSDLTVTVQGDPSEDVQVQGATLVWRGRLDAGKATPVEITYTAMGKGVYELQVPPGKIVDRFAVTLTANSSDLRMMELSLQPAEPVRDGQKTIYKWDYSRLMMGRPIRIDILGVAPMDRLGGLVWLGPVSVLVFGVLAAMVFLAYRPALLDKWTLLLVVGAFAAAYPLMYYAQEFVSLGTAILGACAAMVVILGVRAVTLLGLRVGLFGIVLSAGAILTLTVLAATSGRLQGILLTAEAVGTLVALMVLVPRAQKAFTPPAPPAPPELPRDRESQ